MPVPTLSVTKSIQSKWDLDDYGRAKRLLARGTLPEDKQARLQARVDEHEQGMREGRTWEPTGSLLINEQLQNRAPEGTLPNFSGDRTLYEDPVYYGEGETAAGWLPGTTQPYIHMEPSKEQALEYISSVSGHYNDPESQEKIEVAFNDIQKMGKESKYWKEFADRQWQEVYKAFKRRKQPVIRAAKVGEYRDLHPEEATLGQSAYEAWARMKQVSDPFASGASDILTLGLAREGLATLGRVDLDPEAREALSELEAGGVLLPQAERMKDVQRASPGMSLAGSLAGALTPMGLPVRAAGAARGVRLGGLGGAIAAPFARVAAEAVPPLLRHSTLGKMLWRGTAGVTGAGMAGASYALASGAVERGGSAIRGEEQFKATPEEFAGRVATEAAVGGVFGLGGPLASELIGYPQTVGSEMATGYRGYLYGSRPGGRELRHLKMAHELEEAGEDVLPTSVSTGVKPTKTGVRVQHEAQRIHPGWKEEEIAKGAEEIMLSRLARGAAYKGAEQSGRVSVRIAKENADYYDANMVGGEPRRGYLNETARALLDILGRRRGAAFTDATMQKALGGATDAILVADDSAARALRDRHGVGLIIRVDEAADYGVTHMVREQLEEVTAGLRGTPSVSIQGIRGTTFPGRAEVLGGLPARTIPGRAAPSAKAVLGRKRIVLVPKRVSAQEMDESVWGLDRKISWEREQGAKDEAMEQVAAAIRRDREHLFTGARIKDSHHELLNSIESQKKALGIEGRRYRVRGPQLQTMVDAVRGAGTGNQAKDDAILSLFEQDPELLRYFKQYLGVRSAREIRHRDPRIWPSEAGAIRHAIAKAPYHLDPILAGTARGLRAVGPAGAGVMGAAAAEQKLRGTQPSEHKVGTMPKAIMDAYRTDPDIIERFFYWAERM